jgi:hypothetical protein
MTERPFLANSHEFSLQIASEGAGSLTYLVPCSHVGPVDGDGYFGRVIYWCEFKILHLQNRIVAVRYESEEIESEESP